MAHMRKITFDLETRNFFTDVGSNDPTDLDISVICIHDSLDDSYKSFMQEDFNKLWPILEQADMFITWNGDHFDIPLLNKYYPGDLTKIKSLDLMKEVQKTLGRRLKLDTVAEATLNRNKTAAGAEAVEMWNKKEYDRLISYCTEDVRITKEIYDFAITFKHLKYKDLGNIKDIRIDTSTWEVPQETAMTYTLPF
jgi:DEAD/DEAH box helicase domain-containing protein